MVENQRILFGTVLLSSFEVTEQDLFRGFAQTLTLVRLRVRLRNIYTQIVENLHEYIIRHSNWVDWSYFSILVILEADFLAYIQQKSSRSSDSAGKFASRICPSLWQCTDLWSNSWSFLYLIHLNTIHSTVSPTKDTSASELNHPASCFLLSGLSSITR